MRATSAYRKFTDSQRHALDASRNLVVRANAGSGKTSVLVERVVQLLGRSWDAGERLSLSNLVAITFTRKAAAELQGRLHGSFSEMRRETSDERERHAWTRCIEELPRAMIGTIDGFCARILREFSFGIDTDLGIEPDFEPLEEYERVQLQREAIDRVINRLSSPSDEGWTDVDHAQAEACRWWATREGYGVLSGHLARLLDDVVEPEVIVSTHQGLAPTAERVEAAWRALPAVEQLARDRDELRASLQYLVSEIDKGKAGAKLGEFRGLVAAVLECLQESKRLQDEETLHRLAKAFRTKDGSPRKAGLTSLKGILEPLQEKWCPLLESLTFDYDGEAHALEAADKLALLLHPVHDEYLRLCHEANRYDYTTLARMTRDWLRRSPSVRARLRDRYRYLLIDEFQDVNNLQWEVLAWIAGNGPRELLDRDRLFIVGDPQQSIFRFRQADVSVFQQVQELIRASNEHHGLGAALTDYERFREGVTATMDERLGCLRLAENFRSLTPLPLALVGRVFKHTFDPKAQNFDSKASPFEVEYQPLLAGRPQPDQARGEVCYVNPAHTEDAEDAEDAPAEQNETMTALAPAQVACVVEHLCTLRSQTQHLKDGAQRPLQWGDMAVLLPSRGVVLTALEKEFRRRGVPFVVTGGIGFWQRQEVRDMVSLASCLADRGDELALFAVLRSPLGQMSDTQIFFLSQLGLGNLDRGLRTIEEGAGALLRGRAEGSSGTGGWIGAHWQRVPEPVRAALCEMWQPWSEDTKTALLQTATRLSGWRERVDRLTQADLLQRCLEESGAYALYAAEAEGEQNIANLVRLFDLIRTEEGRSIPSLARLARWLREQRDESYREEQASLANEQPAVQVMTVHAAKGLEFPVVAVLRMDRQVDRLGNVKLLVVSDTDRLLPEHRQQLGDPCPGTLAVSVRHPRWPRESYVPRLLRALRELDKAQQVAESRRLFYVAATRAQERLILAGKQPKPRKSGPGSLRVSWQKWFEEALTLKPEHLQHGSWEDPAAGLWLKIVTRSIAPGGIEKSTSPVPGVPIDVRSIAERPQFPVVATTSLEEMRHTWAREPQAWWLRYRVHLLANPPPPPDLLATASLPDGGNIGTAVGTLVHRIFEMGPASYDSPVSQRRPVLEAMAAALLGAYDGAAVPDQGESPSTDLGLVAQVVEAAEACLGRVLHAAGEAGELRRLLTAPGPPEVAFALRVGRWQIAGRFDKLIPSQGSGGGFEIVDWKTDRDPSQDNIVAKHTPQMRLYALALYRAGQAALVEGTIQVHLALLHHACVRRLQFRPGELESFERELVQEFEAWESF